MIDLINTKSPLPLLIVKKKKKQGVDDNKPGENESVSNNMENYDEEDIAHEEYDILDNQLEELNQALDMLEQKNDDIHKRLKELLQSNRDIRQQLQNENLENAQLQKE